MTEEEGQKGNVPLSVYILYFKEAGIIIMSVTLFCFIVSTAGNLLCNFVRTASKIMLTCFSGFPTGLDRFPILLLHLMRSTPLRIGSEFTQELFLQLACSFCLGSLFTVIQLTK